MEFNSVKEIFKEKRQKAVKVYSQRELAVVSSHEKGNQSAILWVWIYWKNQTVAVGLENKVLYTSQLMANEINGIAKRSEERKRHSTNNSGSSNEI